MPQRPWRTFHDPYGRSGAACTHESARARNCATFPLVPRGILRAAVDARIARNKRRFLKEIDAATD